MPGAAQTGRFRGGVGGSLTFAFVVPPPRRRAHLPFPSSLAGATKSSSDTVRPARVSRWEIEKIKWCILLASAHSAATPSIDDPDYDVKMRSMVEL
jgi:hypothetical protein